MTAVLQTFTFLVPLFYFAAAALYAATFFWHVEAAEKFRRPFFAATVMLHLTHLILRTAHTGHVPIANVYDITAIIAFTLALVYLFIEWQTGVSETGFFVIAVAFLFQAYSSLFITAESSAPAASASPVLQLHIVAALLGYSAIAIAGIYSLLYILLQRDIESNRFSVLFERLPNLESLEKLSTVAVMFGFVFLTAAIATGIIWLPQSKSMSFIEPKLLGTLVIWALYGTGLFLRRQFGWQGRRMAVMLVALFGIAVFSITALNLFSSRFHFS